MNWWVLRRRVHSSWLVTWLCFSFIIGILLSEYIQVSGIIFIYMSLFLLSLTTIKQNILSAIVIIFIGCLLGVVRGSFQGSNLSDVDLYRNKIVSAYGRIIDDAVCVDDNISVGIDLIKLNNESTSGRIYVSLNISEAKRGDIVEFSGVVDSGFGYYDAVMRNAILIKHIKSKSLSDDIKKSFSDKISQFIPENEAMLGLGFLLGEKKTLNEDLVIALQFAGLTHIVVASGYNLTILVRLSRRIFLKKSKYLSLLLSLVMIFSFVSITGLSPSMVRASLVSVLSLLAWYYGRKIHPLTLLMIVASCTLMYDATYLVDNVGWQLSFAAFAGVMIIAPLMTHYFFEKSKTNFVAQLIIETVSAQIATFPILIIVFGSFSSVALIANLLILPIIPFTMFFVFMTGALGYVLPVLGKVFGFLSTLVLDYVIEIAMFFSELPWSIIAIDMNWFVGGILYLIIFIGCFYLHRATGYSLREVNIVE